MCESARVVGVDSGNRRRYKCGACGVLLYSVRDQETDTRTFKTYACRHIGKDSMGKRRLICTNPSTHTGSAGINTYCDDHGGGPPSHQAAHKRRKQRKVSAAEKQRRREADMERYADEHVERASADRYSQPLPEPVKDGGGIGGVHIW